MALTFKIPYQESKRGEITAFLSLIFVLILSFIIAMLESSIVQTTKSQKRLDVDRAVFSAFGEYHTQLLESYDILAIDGSYGTGTYREENLTDHIRYFGTGDMEHEIQGIQYLTDMEGSAFREQVMAYMEHMYGISLIRDLSGRTGTWEEQQVQGKEANQKEAELTDQLETILSENENTLPVENNPLPHVQDLKKAGLLKLVLPESFQISGKQIQFQEQVGVRSIQTGRGSFPVQQGINGVEGRLLFHEYLLKKFDNALEQNHEERNLSYEVEYLIGGADTDEDNLSHTVNQIVGIRFGLNYLYLQSNPAKQAEAGALALTLSTLITLPAITEAVKQAIIAAWAFGESILDLRALLSGKRVATVKNDTNWQLSLSGLLTLGTDEDVEDGMDVDGGLAYADYLRVLLFLENPQQLTMRALDRIEKNIRSETGNTKFCIDQCVVRLKLLNLAQIRDGLTYQFPISFGYNWNVEGSK